MIYTSRIDGLTYESTFRDDDIQNLFLPLLRRLVHLREEKGRRIVIFVSAPPGAGKSTLCDFLVFLSSTLESPCTFASIGIDGFHFRNDYLKSHTAVRNGETILLSRIKGSSGTFDTEALRKKLEQTTKEKEVLWPKYSRILHEPVEDSVRIKEDILFLEGNYLTFPEEHWSVLREYADYILRITAEPEQLRERLLKRRMMSGYSLEESIKAVDYNDMFNIRQCLQHSVPADCTLKLTIKNNIPCYEEAKK